MPIAHVGTPAVGLVQAISGEPGLLQLIETAAVLEAKPVESCRGENLHPKMLAPIPMTIVPNFWIYLECLIKLPHGDGSRAQRNPIRLLVVSGSAALRSDVINTSPLEINVSPRIDRYGAAV